MPEEYGGEAPSIKQLDKETLELVDKYAKWLRETEYFRADESKRTKKASWWNMFNNNNNNVNNQIEKERQILKNLQID